MENSTLLRNTHIETSAEHQVYKKSNFYVVPYAAMSWVTLDLGNRLGGFLSFKAVKNHGQIASCTFCPRSDYCSVLSSCAVGHHPEIHCDECSGQIKTR